MALNNVHHNVLKDRGLADKGGLISGIEEETLVDEAGGKLYYWDAN